MVIEEQSENKVILTVVKKFINVIFNKPLRNDE